MKTFFRISSKQALFAGAIAALAFSIVFLQDNIVQGKGAAVRPLTAAPLAGAKMFLTKTSASTTAGQAILTATSGSDGSFTFPAVTTPQKGNVKLSYTLTVVPPTTYTVTDSKSSGPKATPVTTPVNVSVTFNQQRGLAAGGTIANNGPIGPFSFMTNDSLHVNIDYGGVISGTITK